MNRSRVLTFGGGDELLWATFGNIDAGRGAKTTRVPSRPVVVTDIDGVTTMFDRVNIGGSGIGTVAGTQGVPPGDVYLAAPEGTVNAGDAGVRVSGNLVVYALHVLNADNFDVAGEVSGMPAAEPGPITLELDTGEARKATEEAAETAKQAARAATDQQRALPSLITVEVVGYGGEQEPQEKGARTQDPRSPVKVLGAGELTEEQQKKLTEEQRKKLKGGQAK